MFQILCSVIILVLPVATFISTVLIDAYSLPFSFEPEEIIGTFVIRV